MYIKVRPMSGGQEAVLTVSKLTKVEDFRLMVEEKLAVPPDRQRLFFHGKQLEDGLAMYDYGVNINDVIQLMERHVLAETTTNSSSKHKTKASKVNKTEDKEVTRFGEEVSATEYYKVADLIDACHDGSWWEAKLLKITTAPPLEDQLEDDQQTDGYMYHVEFERYHYELASEVRLHEVRPRASKRLNLDDLKKDDKLMVNYNIDEPSERGYWYHAKVESVLGSDRSVTLVVALHCDKEWVSGCIVAIKTELFQIPGHVRLENRPRSQPVSRVSAPSCKSCHDNPRRRCKECGCCKCGGKEDPDKQLLCDECDRPYHLYCLTPKLEALPDADEWFCPECKNDETEIVRAGEKLKESKKKAKMVCKTTSSSRDWGKGYACAGRTKQCTIVPPDHYGPIPGVEVGTQWLYRIQASEAGVHRPPVSGIHGRASDGAYSIVLSGGYEDDEDDGDTFTYTGAGGRDLSGNKRTAEQSSDQRLDNTNRALAINANCKVSGEGRDAGEDWRGGKPLRVIRSYKGRKHSHYAPEEGIRYDGIYKVCKYWTAAGKSGFKVWRYLMKRDDPVPAPWTEEGKERIKRLGLVMQYPPDKEEKANDDTRKSKKAGKGKGVKRKASDDEDNESGGSASQSLPKKSKRESPAGYAVEEDVHAAIAADTANTKLWQECLAAAKEGGYQEFVRTVESEFSCVCCQELLLEPVTTTCLHNACLACVRRSFAAQVYACPACRHDLGSGYSMPVNKKLFTALKTIFPGYRGTGKS